VGPVRVAWAMLLATLVLVAPACGAEEEEVAEPEWATCTNDQDEWSAEYPEDWHAYEGDETMSPCSLFDPEPIQLEEGPGEVPLDIAVQLRMEAIAQGFEDLLEDPFAEELDREERTVDGHTAHRIEQEQTEDGIVPAGARSVRYVVDLGNSAFLAVAYDVGEPDFERKVEVLDEMMERLTLDVEEPPENDEPAPPPDDDVDAGAWEELPDAPIEPRLNHSVTWVDGHVVVWGGGDGDAVQADGAAWSAETREWQELPEAPIAARWGHEAFSDGPRLLVWGGTAGPDHLAECFVDGAIYDLETREWQVIPEAPGGARCGAAVVVSAQTLYVFGGYDSEGPPMPDDLHDDGVAYDVESGEWSEITAAPVDPRWGAVAAWTGSELVVWGGIGPEQEPLADGAAYDPEAGEWRTIAESPLPPRNDAAGAWVGDELVVFGGRAQDAPEQADRTDGAAYDPEEDAWRELAEMPWALSSVETAWTGDVLYVLGSPAEGEDGSPFLAYVPAEDGWVERPDPPAGERRNHGLAWTGAELVVWGGQSEEDPTPPGAVWSPPS
jgi:hypothetical protein